MREIAPAAIGVGLWLPGFGALVAILVFVERYKLPEVYELMRVLFEGVVDIGAVVVRPDGLGPGVLAAGFFVDGDHNGLYAVGVENASEPGAGWCAPKWFLLAFCESFAGTTFEVHVVGQHHGRLAGGFEHAADVLHEVEMVVAGAGPKVLTVVGVGFPFLLSLSVVEGLAASCRRADW